MESEDDFGTGLTAEDIAAYVAALGEQAAVDDPSFLDYDQYRALLARSGVVLAESTMRHRLVAAVRSGRLECRRVWRNGRMRLVYRPVVAAPKP